MLLLSLLLVTCAVSGPRLHQQTSPLIPGLLLIERKYVDLLNERASRVILNSANDVFYTSLI